MRRRLRRFGIVGLAVTVVDVGLLLVLRLGTGMPVIAADAVSITVAAWASYLLHRTITFGDDPHLRWVKEPATFAWVTLMAGLVDILFVRAGVAVASALGAGRVTGVLVPKLIALAMAAGVRVTRVPPGAVPSRAHRAGPAPRPAPAARCGAAERRRPRLPRECRGSPAPSSSCGSRWPRWPTRVGSRSSSSTTAPTTTRPSARAAGADQVLVLPANRGKGAAVRAGMLAAHGRAVAFTDADLSYPPDQLLRLLAEVESGWDVVVGSRRHVETTTLVKNRRLREVSGRLFNTLTVAVLLGQYRDTQCGLKAFRADAARLLFSHAHVDGFAFDVELFHLTERYRLSLAEVPVELANSTTSSVRVGVDAVRMLRDLFRVRRWAAAGRYDLDPADERLTTTN